MFISHSSTAVPEQIQNISYTSTDNSLTFSWDHLSCEDINGAFREFEYFLRDELTQKAFASEYTTDTTATFSELYSCASYTFNVRTLTTSLKFSDWANITAVTGFSGESFESFFKISYYNCPYVHIAFESNGSIFSNYRYEAFVVDIGFNSLYHMLRGFLERGFNEKD